MEQRHVGVTFTGGVWASLGYPLLWLVLSLFIIPTAWGAVAFFGWWCAAARFSDGTRADFEGRAGRIWPLFAVATFLAVLPQLATSGMEHDGRRLAVQGLLALVLIPCDAAVKLPLYRWLIENIRLSPGGTARFHGRYLPFLGWSALVTVAAMTLIFGPFAAVGMARWVCRNIEGEGFGLEFHGSGWGLLGMSLLWMLGTMLVIPIPWVLRSVFRWWTENLRLIRFETAGASLP
ncbi:MAG: hypothetical protein ACP59X_20100 [Solidesulfovibrio sp. DCME]|uniref:hypothetical protein n=1 Tax=Solidesulfovibrio sp. DCME TaxID=3447380 RepID=UPI003D0A65BE